ncbi:MAG TPA: efflux transporter outer membrane subunit [Candidatus Polarisedimenticolia bacterium]|nr:efflux transporter outer membrane subunit [Candidatus Polarisedimenticolia bacterium]
MKRMVAILLGSLLLVGCAVGPNYSRPPITTPEAFRGEAAPGTPTQTSPVAGAAEAGSLADRSWWEIFPDEILQSLIDEALKNGYDIRLAAARVAEARAGAGIARAEYFPAIQGQAGWLYGQGSEFTSLFTETDGLYTANLGLSWEIDLWGRIRRLNEAALAQYMASEEARRGVMLSLVSDVAASYLQLRALDTELEIAERTAAAFQETRDLFQRRYEAGTASTLETSSAAASLSTTLSTIPDLRRQIAAEENHLALLLGRAPGDVPRGAALDDQILPPEIPAGLPADLLKRRPDLRQAEQELVAANAEVGVAVAEMFPTIRLTGVFGGVAPQVSELFGKGKTWSVGAGLLTPVFQGRRLKNQHRAALARWEQAKVRYERDVTNAFGEVSTSLVAYRELAGVEAEQTHAVASYQQAVELANERYLSGLADYLEVLLAQRQLFPAENALARTRYDRLAVLVQLYRALGGGWSLPDDQWAKREQSVREPS